MGQRGGQPPNPPTPMLDEASSQAEPAGLSSVYKKRSRVIAHTPVTF